jgi:hypothetical protein
MILSDAAAGERRLPGGRFRGVGLLFVLRRSMIFFA